MKKLTYLAIRGAPASLDCPKTVAFPRTKKMIGCEGFVAKKEEPCLKDNLLP